MESQYPDYITTEDDVQRFLREFPVTETLSVVGLEIAELGWLSKLPYLHTLYIQGFYHSGNHPTREDTVADFSGICDVKTLRHLSIHDCRHFGDDAIKVLAKGGPPLKRISISSFMPTISTITPLCKLCVLEEIDFAGYWRKERRHWITKTLLGTFADSLEKQANIIQHHLPHCRIILRMSEKHAPYPSEFWGKTIPRQ